VGLALFQTLCTPNSTPYRVDEPGKKLAEAALKGLKWLDEKRPGGGLGPPRGVEARPRKLRDRGNGWST